MLCQIAVIDKSTIWDAHTLNGAAHAVLLRNKSSYAAHVHQQHTNRV